MPQNHYESPSTPTSGSRSRLHTTRGGRRTVFLVAAITCFGVGAILPGFQASGPGYSPTGSGFRAFDRPRLAKHGKGHRGGGQPQGFEHRRRDGRTRAGRWDVGHCLRYQAHGRRRVAGWPTTPGLRPMETRACTAGNPAQVYHLRRDGEAGARFGDPRRRCAGSVVDDLVCRPRLGSVSAGSFDPNSGKSRRRSRAALRRPSLGQWESHGHRSPNRSGVDFRVELLTRACGTRVPTTR
jgi:hypothetical protein